MRKRFRDLASLVALAASGYALYRTWRVDTRLGVALTLVVVGIAVHAMCREPAGAAHDELPGADIAVLTARRIRDDAMRQEEKRRRATVFDPDHTPPEWRK